MDKENDYQVLKRGMNELSLENKILLQEKELLFKRIQEMSEKSAIEAEEYARKLQQEKDISKTQSNEFQETIKNLQSYIEKQESHIQSLQVLKGGEDSEVMFNYSHSLKPFIDRVNLLQQEKVLLKEENLCLENKYTQIKDLYDKLNTKMEENRLNRLEEKSIIQKRNILSSDELLTESNSSKTNTKEVESLKLEIRNLRNKLCDVGTKYTSLICTPPKVRVRTVIDEEAEQKLFISQKELFATQQQLQITKRKSEEKICDLEKQIESLSEKLSAKEKECAEMKVGMDSFKEIKAQCERLKNTNKTLTEKVLYLESSSKRYQKSSKEKTSLTTGSLKALSVSLQAIKKEQEEIYCFCEKMRKQLSVDSDNSKLKDILYSFTLQYKDLSERYEKECVKRKILHNELIELKGSIRVLCRVRPVLPQNHEVEQPIVNGDPKEDDTLLVHINNDSQKVFKLDKVFHSKTSQEKVFSDIRALIQTVLDGSNVCVFAYGQTGSGKTFTMEGTDENPGINPRALHLLFEETNQLREWNFNLFVTFLEIYNETLRDLLSVNNEKKLEIKESLKDAIMNIPGLTCVPVKTPKDVNDILRLGQCNRKTASTDMNNLSSRSHSILTITVIGRNERTGAEVNGKLNLVDLAGSERVSRSGASGVRMKEAQCINKSLSALGDVIHALRNKKDHIPYRNSKLTYLLKDSLSAKSKTLMMVQVSPLSSDASETLCTLNFAQRVQGVEMKRMKKK